MKIIYEPVKIEMKFPKEVLEYLVSLGYLTEYNSYCGDTCIKSYVAKKELSDVILYQMLDKKNGGDRS